MKELSLVLFSAVVAGTSQPEAERPADQRTVQQLLQEADALFKVGDWTSLKAALPLYVQAASEAPTSYEAQWKASRAHTRLGDEVKWRQEQDWEDQCARLGKEGMQYGARAIELDPIKAPAYIFYSSSVGTYADGVSVVRTLAEGLKDKTQHALEKAYDIDKMYERASPVLGLGRFWSALPWPLRDDQKALAFLREHQTYFPGDPEGQLYLAEVLLRKGEDKEGAESKGLLINVTTCDNRYFVDSANRLLDRFGLRQADQSSSGGNATRLSRLPFGIRCVGRPGHLTTGVALVFPLPRLHVPFVVSMASSRREEQQPEHHAEYLFTAEAVGNGSCPNGNEATHSQELQGVPEADPYGLNASLL